MKGHPIQLSQPNWNRGLNTMLEIVTSTVGGIAAIFAIFGGVLTVIVFIRKKQFATPTLRFTVGPSMHVSDELPRRHRKRPVSIIAYSADDTGSFPVIIPMIYSLENRGKEALRNLRLLIEYNKSFVMDNELLRSVTKFEPAVLSVKKDHLVVMRGATDEEIRKISERREVQVFGDRAQVSYEISLIRPGESIVLCDTLMLQPRQICGLDGLGFGDKGFANILEQLRKIEGLHNFFVLNVWMFAENHEKKKQGIPFTPVGGGDSLMGWTARQIWCAMVADAPLPGLIIRGRFRRWMSGSGTTSDAGTISIGCVGRTGLPADTADGLESRG